MNPARKKGLSFVALHPTCIPLKDAADFCVRSHTDMQYAQRSEKCVDRAIMKLV